MENYIVLNGNKIELTDEQIKQLGISLGVGKRWRADAGEVYYYVDESMDGSKSTYRYDYRRSIDDYLYYSHNYFRTEEEAETYAMVLETEMLLKKFADEHNPFTLDWKDPNQSKYYLRYVYDTSNLSTPYVFNSREPRTTYFASQVIAQQAIKEIGEDRIIEYLTYEG